MKAFSLLLVIAVCLGAGGVSAEPAPAAAPKAADRCPPEPGSRISRKPAADGRCLQSSSALARSYTREDLERTGQLDVRDALHALDPSLAARSVTVDGR